MDFLVLSVIAENVGIRIWVKRNGDGSTNTTGLIERTRLISPTGTPRNSKLRPTPQSFDAKGEAEALCERLTYRASSASFPRTSTRNRPRSRLCYRWDS